MNEEYQRILRRLVRVGVISSVNTHDLTARVYFEDVGMVSDWLPVLQHSGAAVSVKAAGHHTHDASVSIIAGGAHTHDAGLGAWMPDVGVQVVCLYLPLFNSDGFILGAIT